MDDENRVDIVDDLLTEDNSDVPYGCGNHEISHYYRAFLYMTPLPAGMCASDTLGVDQAMFIVLDWFRDYWLREVEGGGYIS